MDKAIHRLWRDDDNDEKHVTTGRGRQENTGCCSSLQVGERNTYRTMIST